MHRTLLAAAIAVAAASGIVFLAHAKELELSIDDLQAPGFSAQSVRATFAGPRLRQLTLDVERLTAVGRVWRKVKLHCPELDATGARIACSRGVLDAGEKIPVSFSYVPDKRELAVELKPAADEIIRVDGRVAGSETALRVKMDRAKLDRFATWLPAGAPKMTDGRATGELQMQGTSIKARFEVAGVGFSDASGLHAGEKISATLEADATGKGDDWRW